VFLLSAGALALEVLETRIFSVAVWHHLTYLLVTVALLGFGAGAALLAVVPALGKRPAATMSWSGALFATTAIATLALLGRAPPDTSRLLEGPVAVAASFFEYGYLVLPFLFAGLGVAVALSEPGAPVNARYAWNLAGSGIGCFLFVGTVSALGAPRAAALFAGIGAAAAIAFARGSTSGPRVGALAALVLCVSTFAFAERVLPVPLARSKLLAANLRENPQGEIVATVWSPLCRIDALNQTGAERPSGLLLFQDGDAPTNLFSKETAAGGVEGSWATPASFAAAIRANPIFRVDPPVAIYSLAHLFVEEPEVLVIGVGGGQDLLTAIHHGARSATGVEVNRAMRDLVAQDLREFAGDVFGLPGVRVQVAEGRSYLRASRERFDVIQMTGTDSYAALASGAYVLSESYLYTREAMADYLSHLRPRGILAILRFEFDPPRENLRLFGMALEALAERGFSPPSAHAAVVGLATTVELEGKPVEARYAVALFRLSPFLPEDRRRLEEFCAPLPGVRLLFAPGDLPESSPYASLAAAFDEGTERDWFERYPFDASPVTDDRPFFFQYHRWSELFAPREVGRGSDAAEEWLDITGRGPIGLWILLALLLQTGIAALLLMVLPLAVVRGRSVLAPGSGKILAYFAALGVGFLALEIASIQRLVLFLGHPVYSITVTLFSFLVFPGIGSAITGRLSLPPLRTARAAVFVVLLVAAAHALFLDQVTGALLGAPLPARVLVAILLLAPLGLPLGVPFPSGLRAVAASHPPLVPWAIAVNGATSVVGSVACILVAMGMGFRATFLAAAAAYALGTAPLLRTRQ
jgi:hypothetical protein